MQFEGKIARSIKPLYEYRNDAWRCIRCGSCRLTHMDHIQSHKYTDNCPRGMKHRFESYYATGTHNIIRALTLEPPELEIDDHLKEVIFTCTVCGSCNVICNGLKFLEPANAMMALRDYVVRREGLMPAHQTLVQSILNYDNPWLSPRAQRARWAKRLKDAKVKDASKEKVEVLFFVGCNESYVSDLIPVAETTARVLSMAGVDFGILGAKERCCGSTAFRVGANEMFEKYRKDNIEMLNGLGIKTMVTACAGCHSTFSHQYAGDLNFEILHMVEFLDRLVQEGKIDFKNELGMNATYHDPCHIGRYSGIFDAPRSVLQALPGVNFQEMERIREWSLCCGCGGGVKTAYPDLALEVANWRLDEALDIAKSDVVVSCCPFCESNLGDAAKSREDHQFRVADIMELVSEAMGYEKGE